MYLAGYLLGRAVLAADRLLNPQRAASNAWEAHLASVPGLDDQAEYRAAWAKHAPLWEREWAIWRHPANGGKW